MIWQSDQNRERFPFRSNPVIQLLASLFILICPPQRVVILAPASGGAGKTPLYYPTKLGAKWVYDLNGKEETETITAVEKKEGAFLITVHKVDEFGREEDVEMKLAADGLFILTGLAKIHPPSHVLKLPHKAGATWETYTGAWPLWTSEFTAHGPERIEVPAGKFDAIRVEATDAGKLG